MTNDSVSPDLLAAVFSFDLMPITLEPLQTTSVLGRMPELWKVDQVANTGHHFSRSETGVDWSKILLPAAECSNDGAIARIPTKRNS
jgi:hypothetical protein